MEKDHLEVLLEDIREKFDLVLEGHDVLRKDIGNLRNEVRENKDETNFKLDALHQRVENVREELSGKIDGVANDLAAHRADTESHSKGYNISDGK
jgi:uncharacterized coiled-coil DUF342 family protein